MEAVLSHPYVEAAQPLIDRVTENAGSEWRKQATYALDDYLLTHEIFLVEDLRAFAEPFIGLPHDSRAWGGIIQRAAKAGKIRPDGVARAKSSHGSWKPVWRRIDLKRFSSPEITPPNAAPIREKETA